jgi:hypothetical protein
MLIGWQQSTRTGPRSLPKNLRYAMLDDEVDFSLAPWKPAAVAVAITRACASICSVNQTLTVIWFTADILSGILDVI